MANSGAQLEAFQTQIYPSGLDLHRCSILIAKGVWKAGSANFRQGAPVMLNASREVVLSDGTAFLGVAKWPKMSLGQAVEVDEQISFTAAGQTVNLKRAGIAASSLQIRTATQFGGSAYTVTTDYTVNTTNGTVTQVALGAIPVDGTIIYVTYTWSLTEAHYKYQGKNFYNNNDWVSLQADRITVIEAPAEIYTTEYDTDQVYALTGANSNIYVNASGQFTTVAGGSKLHGFVSSLPSAKDPFLGIKLIGTVVANT